MKITPSPSTPLPANTKPLWAAVGLLGVAVLGLGGALVYTQTRAPQVSTPVAVVAAAPQAQALPAPAVVASVEKEEKKPVTVVNSASSAPKNIAKVVSKPVHAPAGAVLGANQGTPIVLGAAVPASKPVCVYCATVESVLAVEREGPASGAGAVAGGVLGAIVGNQMGDGNGRAAATILGALGGGWAGNSVEKKIKKATVYEVRIRLDDGTQRTLELASPVGVGAHVTVEGNSLRLPDGSVVSPLPPPKPVSPATNPARTEAG